jgi:hypothetical protein
MLLSGVTFSSGNGNLVAAPAAPGTASLEAALSLLRQQTDEAGRYLSMRCAVIAVPPGYELETNAVVNSAWGTDPSRPVVVAEPRLLSANAWFVFCPPTSRPVVRVLTLRGSQGPRVSMGRDQRYVDAQIAKVSHDCNAVAVDTRGCIKVPLT